MLIKKAPEKLSNTKLSSCAKIIENLSGDGWTIKVRPHSIYKMLGTHPIFIEFAHSNQKLCESLRPLLDPSLNTDNPGKPFNEGQFKSNIDSLQDKISYTSPTDNNLSEYLANLLLYKAFLLDAKSQIPQARTDEYNQKIGYENRKKLEEQEKKVENCKKEVAITKKPFNKSKTKISQLKHSREKCEDAHKKNEECKSEFNESQLSAKEAGEGTKEWKAYLDSKKKFEESKKEFKEFEDDYWVYKEHDEYANSYEGRIEEYEEAQKKYQALEGYELYGQYKSLEEHKILREYEKLDYKVSVHIRFTRTMNALNAYTQENFTTENFKKYGKPYQETGISDEYGRRIAKYINLMKLERRKINRYVTVQDGGVYTTVTVDKESKSSDRIHERTKFRYTKDNARSVPIWNYLDHKEDTYTLKQRIKDSCDSFNKLIDKYVISTYANYYGVDNVLRVGEDKRLYLDYVYNPEKTEKELEIPRYVDDDNKKKEALLHVLIGAQGYKENIYNPTVGGDFHYQPIPFHDRKTGVLDILGLLYAIRKGKIAVSFTDIKEGFHSSMWSGKKVQAAGLLAAWNGKLIAVDNMSGHYKPNWYLTYMAWKPFYDKGVFHENGIIGIAAPSSNEKGEYCNQFFNVKTFMELAEKDFEIGKTAQILGDHIKEMKDRNDNGGIDVVDQSQHENCNDVLMTPHVIRYHRIWKNENETTLLASGFINSLNYNWGEILPGIKNAYELFRGKKTLLWRAKKIENVFKDRTKKLQKAIKKSNINYGQEEEKRKKLLIAATDSYKKVFSEIGTNSESGENEIFKLVKCTADIYFADKNYSELVETVVGSNDKGINKCQYKIDAWVNLIEPLIKAKADRRVGLDIEAWETYTPGPLLSNEGENYPGKRDVDDLGNGVDVTSEVEPAVKAKRLLLVDKRVYEQQRTETPPTKRDKSKTTQTSTRPTAQPRQQPKKTRSGGGEKFWCNDCHQEVVINSYNKSLCPKCGHTGCLDRIK